MGCRGVGLRPSERDRMNRRSSEDMFLSYRSSQQHNGLYLGRLKRASPHVPACSFSPCSYPSTERKGEGCVCVCIHIYIYLHICVCVHNRRILYICINIYVIICVCVCGGVQ